MNPPLSFLLEASARSLQDFELSRLNHAANLRKEIRILLEAAIDEEANARLARWLIDNRERLSSIANLPEEVADPQCEARSQPKTSQRADNRGMTDAAD